MNPRAMLLPQLIRYRAEESGDRVFLRRVEGGEMSYCDYHVQALEWAWAFERVGVAAQDRVACMLPNGFDVPLAWLGCAWLKAQLAVINPAYRGRMLEDVLTTIGARIFVISRHYLDQLDGIDLTRTGIGMLIVVDEDAPQVAGIEAIGRAAFLAGATPQPREGPEPHDVACIIFTSGTTGPSKAVMVHWGQLNATSTDRTGLEMGPDDVWYSPLPMFHLTGFGPIYKMAMVGGSVVIRQLLSLKDYFTDIEAFGATGAVLMESMILMLMRQSETDFVKPPLLRQVITVPVPAHIDAFREKFGVAVATMYNMTELGTPLASDGYDVDASYTGSCGRLREELYEARIVDPLDYPVEDGAVGELILRPKKPWTITTAYFNNPAGTAEAWRNGWFHTGDAFRRDAEG
ncbi:MAG: AMP-binding protein, partial [Sphingobium sp.]